MRTRVLHIIAAVAAALALPGGGRAAPTPVDRADPAVVEEELARPIEPAPDIRRRPPPPVAEAPAVALSRPVTVGAIRIEGLEMLPAAAFAPVLEPWLGRTLSPDELRSLAAEIADVARASGYGLATAWIPPQRVAGGLLRVHVDEGRLDAVEASGSAADRVERALAPLVGGRPVPTAELERRLLLAGDLAGVRIGTPRLVRREGRSILLIAAEQDRVRGRALADNWGTEAIGPVRLQLSAELAGLIAGDDRLSIGGVVTPLDPSEFGLVRLGYSTRVGSAGTELSVGGYLARTEPGGFLADLDYEGRSAEIFAGLSHPFLRTRAASLWGEIGLTLRDSEQDRAGLALRDDRIAALTLGGSAALRFGQARARLRIALVRGIDAFGATQGGDPLASRADADGTFTKLELWGHYDAPIGSGFSVQAQAQAQLADQALLSSEEMGLGGRYFLRGYDYREASGDRGAAASFELRRDFGRIAGPVDALQLYGYADAGTVGNLEGGSGGATLASAGGGMRSRIARTLDLGVELGVPVGDGESPRVSVTIGSNF